MDIHRIKTGFVNCYLIKTESGFFMIDTGIASKRIELVSELEHTGCKPENLVLILVTHGDSDHCGNCAYLREKFGAKIAMHPAEAEIVASGEMLSSRRPRQSPLRKILIKSLTPFVSLKKSDRFTADLSIEDGTDLSDWEFNARVLHLPGHSNGSIGVLTADGELFCGDLIDNNDIPRLHMVDDPAAANASLEKLRQFMIKIVYPGHGAPFTMDQLTTEN